MANSVWSDSWITKKIFHPRGNRIIDTIDEYLLNQLSLPVSFQDYRLPRKIAWFYFHSIIPLDGIGNFLVFSRGMELKGWTGWVILPLQHAFHCSRQSCKVTTRRKLLVWYLGILLFHAIFYLSPWSNSGNSKPCCNCLFNKIDST